MKIKRLPRFTLLLLSVFLMFSLTACSSAKTSRETAGSSVSENMDAAKSNTEAAIESNSKNKNDDDKDKKMINAKIVIGNKVFSAKLFDNESTQALVSKLPMTVNMTELNGREKYYRLQEKLPAKSTEAPATIHAGEIMCWSSYSLVLFYNTFSNSYGDYVRLGYIEDVSELKEALGKGDVQVTFEVSK
ncbi:MAG: cyclophilin-like fold protein [Acidaminococcaceae bacterium]